MSSVSRRRSNIDTGIPPSGLSTSSLDFHDNPQQMSATGSGTPATHGAVVTLRQASKAYSTPMAARNNDLKYKAKYTELKKKVKEIETDNERLQVHLLKTKKNIERLRLERAIMYERLLALNQQPAEPRPTSHAPHPNAAYAQPHLRPASYSESAASDTDTPGHLPRHSMTPPGMIHHTSHERDHPQPNVQSRILPESAMRGSSRSHGG